MATFTIFSRTNKAGKNDQILEGYPAMREGRPILPNPGESIILDFIPDGLDSMPARYHTSVKAMNSRRIILTDLTPMVPGASEDPFAKLSRAVIGSFNREGALYQFETAPLKAGSEWGIARPKQVVKIERRHFYRMLLESSTRYRLEPGDREMRLAARISNLSAGGVLLTTTAAITAGQRIVLIVPTGKEGLGMEVAADVIDSIPWPDGATNGFFVRARFVTSGSMAVHIDTLEEIVKYIFEQQRLMLKARKLTGA